MPQIINCPDCDRKLRVPDELLGKKVRCPTCSVMFRAVAVGGQASVEDPVEEPDEEPAPRRTAAARDERYAASPRSGRRRVEDEDEEDVRPRRRREVDEDDEDDDYYSERRSSGRDRQAGWGKVRIGINLVMIGTWVWLAGAVLGGLGILLGVVLLGGAIATAASQGGGLASAGAAGILLLLSIGLYVVCNFAELILRLIGYGLCMAAPAQRNTGLRPLAITAFALAVAYTLFYALNMVLSGVTGFMSSLTGRASANAAGTGASLLSGLCAIASFIVFMFFLRSVCNNARARHLASGPMSILIALIVYWVLAIFLLVIVGCAGGISAAKAAQGQSAGGAAAAMGTWAIILIIVVGMLGLVYLGLQVWYIMVLQKIRDAVASYSRRL